MESYDIICKSLEVYLVNVREKKRGLKACCFCLLLFMQIENISNKITSVSYLIIVNT